MPPLKLKLSWETEFHDDLLQLFIVSEEEKSHICSLSVSFHVFSCFPGFLEKKNFKAWHTHTHTQTRAHTNARTRTCIQRWDHPWWDHRVSFILLSFPLSPLPNVTFNLVTFAVALETWSSCFEQQEDNNNKTKMKNKKQKKTIQDTCSSGGKSKTLRWHPVVWAPSRHKQWRRRHINHSASSLTAH